MELRFRVDCLIRQPRQEAGSTHWLSEPRQRRCLVMRIVPRETFCKRSLQAAVSFSMFHVEHSPGSKGNDLSTSPNVPRGTFRVRHCSTWNTRITECRTNVPRGTFGRLYVKQGLFHVKHPHETKPKAKKERLFHVEHRHRFAKGSAVVIVRPATIPRQSTVFPGEGLDGTYYCLVKSKGWRR